MPTREQIDAARTRIADLVRQYEENAYGDHPDVVDLRILLAATAQPTDEELALEAAEWHRTNRGILRVQSTKQSILQAYECGAMREGRQ
jgi:hypothetical protein